MTRDTVHIDKNDSVVVALRAIKKGEVIDDITVLEDIKPGHKIAIKDIAKGDAVIKYGSIIGKATEDIKRGSWIHSHNIRTTLEEGASYSYNPVEVPSLTPIKRTFSGYLREDGRAGTRNDLYIVPLVGCCNSSVRRLKEMIVEEGLMAKSSIKVLEHPYGCSQLGEDHENTRHLLAALAANPNAGATMIVGLGCENNRLGDFMKIFKPASPTRVRAFNLQDHDDDLGYMLEKAKELIALLKEDKREEIDISKLVIGLKCGGSDGFSGLTANPLVGRSMDQLGADEVKIALTEVPEMFGAEQQLMNRAKDEETYNKVVDLINDFKDYYRRNNQVCYENPSPGNKEGGITTLEEKSLGCVRKGGLLKVVDVLDYAEPIKKAGLTLVNGPGNDIVASTNLAAAGATLLIFTTGRGTPLGGVIPTIKVATNHDLARRKKKWIDFDAEIALDIGFEKASEELIDLIIRVASGEDTANESYLSGDIALFKSGVTL